MSTNDKTTLVQELAGAMKQIKRIGMYVTPKDGLRHSEFLLLATLANLTESSPKGVKVSEISSRLQITPAAVTHMINSLEESGQVERLADPVDRRIVLVKLTKSGQDTMEQRNEQFLEKLTGLVEYLGEKDSEELIRLLSATFTYFKEKGNNNAGKL